MTPWKWLVLCAVIINIGVLNAFRQFDVNGVETIFATEKEIVNIRCKTEMPMAYCGFIHPNGTRYSFSGPTLNVGQCAIKIQASKNDSGVWRCHIGNKGAIGVEIMQVIRLRVVGELAALQKNISAVHGKPVTIACATTKGLVPLRYCRFEPPKGTPFSINSEVTEANAILGRFYFPGNLSVDRGDCAVTLRKVKYEDVGRWTCGAGLDDGRGYTDTVTLDVKGLYTMSTASATGITFGALALFLIILGFVVWKNRRYMGAAPAQQEQELVELSQHGSQRSPCPSVRVPLHGSRQVSPTSSMRASPSSKRKSPHGSRQPSPHGSREASPRGSRRHLQRSKQQSGSRQELSQGSRQTSPRSSPRLCRKSVVPDINVQSPSDKSFSSA